MASHFVAGSLARRRVSRQRPLLVAAVALLGLPVSAQVERQPAPAAGDPSARFEVASIAPSGGTEAQRAPMGRPGGWFEMTNMPLRSLVGFAFRVRNNEIVGLPNWATTERYTVRARSELASPSPEQLRSMVQDLLRSRFGMVSHEEPRPIDVLALVAATSGRKPGPRLVSRAEPCKPGVFETVTVEAMPQAAGRQLPCPGFLSGPTWLYATGMQLPMFAELLSNALLGGTRVVDRSQMEGAFDIRLEYAPLAAPGDSPSLGPAPLLAALQDQLGLKLEPARELMNVLVVDRLERPTGN